MKWFPDDSDELKKLLEEHGYDADDFLDALSFVPDTTEARMIGMNRWLSTNGDKDLMVHGVRENEEGTLDWIFVYYEDGRVVE